MGRRSQADMLYRKVNTRENPWLAEFSCEFQELYQRVTPENLHMISLLTPDEWPGVTFPTGSNLSEECKGLALYARFHLVIFGYVDIENAPKGVLWWIKQYLELRKANPELTALAAVLRDLYKDVDHDTLLHIRASTQDWPPLTLACYSTPKILREISEEARYYLVTGGFIDGWHTSTDAYMWIRLALAVRLRELEPIVASTVVSTKAAPDPDTCWQRPVESVS